MACTMGRMKMTRHFHSCIEIAESGTSVIVDPGSFDAPGNLAEVDAVLITHIHPDHIDVDALANAREANPQLQVFGPAGLAEVTNLEFRTVQHGDRFRIGAIDVEVHASAHATIIRSKDLPENLGYIFNKRVFHPGDSFPDLPNMELVLVPISGPWMRMLDVDRYLEDNRPATFIGVHDGLDNNFGLNTRSALLTQLSEDHSLTYLNLAPGDSHELP